MPSNFIEITLRYGCSPVNLLHIFRTLFRKNTYGGLLLNWASLRKRFSFVKTAYMGIVAIACSCCSAASSSCRWQTSHAFIVAWWWWMGDCCFLLLAPSGNGVGLPDGVPGSDGGSWFPFSAEASMIAFINCIAISRSKNWVYKKDEVNVTKFKNAVANNIRNISLIKIVTRNISLINAWIVPYWVWSVQFLFKIDREVESETRRRSTSSDLKLYY